MDCISFVLNDEEKALRAKLNAPAKNLTQDLYVSGPLKTQRVMVKDENVCLHCGLCAERCPTGAWDMQKYLIDMTLAGTPAVPYHKKAQLPQQQHNATSRLTNSSSSAPTPNA